MLNLDDLCSGSEKYHDEPLLSQSILDRERGVLLLGVGPTESSFSHTLNLPGFAYSKAMEKEKWVSAPLPLLCR